MWWKGLFLFFFPSSCLTCGKKLNDHREILCLSCEYDLPRTGYGENPDNPVNQVFWGRVPVENATSLLRFEKGSVYQGLLHDLKYRGNKEAGLYLGRLLGLEIKGTAFAQCRMIIPVPLHRKRFIERGYNQSEVISKGISQITGIPLNGQILKRTHFHSSQTILGRLERYENVSRDFALASWNPEIHGLTVLLVDDVVTTGATLEACAGLLIEKLKLKVYIATVFCA